ncbi:MAG: hypothetical protein RLZZ436_4043 [Planctomycetota bacterium]|jgi:uncharacterized protein (DUF1501 family)
MSLHRRRFLAQTASGSLAIALAAGAPYPLLASSRLAKPGRVLVVIELQGGNDGLNTVVPATDPVYRQLRPELAIGRADVLSIDDHWGFHPALTGFAELLESGRLAIVQGVGYPNPNRSHFESMDIWHTCRRRNEGRVDGWLGRWLEKSPAGTDPQAMHLGADKLPLALLSRRVRVPSVDSLEDFRLRGTDDPRFRAALQSLAEAPSDTPAADAPGATDGGLLSFVQSSTSAAITASDRLAAVAAKAADSSVVWPRSPLGERLKNISKLIRSGLDTSLYYTTLAGFDTHAQQPDAHRSLLRQLGDSVQALLNELQESGDADRVTVLAFSEFGRRVGENASAGTDHGTAGPVFLAGPAVQAGLHGPSPDLNALQDGDLQFTVDFREVYAAVLKRWLQVDPTGILPGEWKGVDVFRG